MIEDVLAKHSYQELLQLCNHFYYYGPIPIIIGGWAVFFYNSYHGSVDIDIVGPSMEGRLMYILSEFQEKNGYEEYAKDNLGLVKSYRKIVYEDGNHIGEIEIDACTYEEGENPFHEDESKTLPYSLCDEENMSNKINLNDERKTIKIPSKSLLLLYKIKAFRDRRYDITNKRALLDAGTLTWLEGKKRKDGSDITALLDPHPENHKIHQKIDAQQIKKILDKHDLHFMLNTLKELHNEKESLTLYRYANKDDVHKWSHQLLDDITN